MTRTGLLVAAALGLAACPVPQGVDRIPLSACDLGRAVDYVGVFELGSGSASRNGTFRTQLRLVEPVISTPANAPPEVGARPEVARLRTAERGFELTAELGVSEPVAVGTEAVVFLVHSAVFSTWADFNAQGVFLAGDAGYWNEGRYDRSNPIPLEVLLSEARRGSQLPRTSGPPCFEPRREAIDAGENRARLADGGTP